MKVSRRRVLQGGAAVPLAVPAVTASRASAVDVVVSARSVDVSEPADLSLVECAAALGSGRLSSVELTEACLQRGLERDRATTVPLAMKDIIAAKGLPLTASSRVLEGNIAPGDSTVWRRPEEAGMVLLGHAETDEFAFGTSTPQTGNPWDPVRSAGGSSGGP